ncbi:MULTISPECIES: nuclear transport factor 2 family protein [Microbulbifer]|uniref:nuclear transport factor 2 family protein n=1 Tax=Microbulbifer TaxID=48073 RepID=UPI001E57A44F|nr:MULTISPECIES: nuclear transport factor 2 family protein [Microbulbifer]UHQ54588.1 nuclear transport factor 2 family protein [Microbulbifer sp. YPW16]
MNKVFLFIVAVLLSAVSSAKEPEFDAEKFANEYFQAFVATQAPDAKPEDIENYLSLLKDDVGSQHIPFDTDDSRKPDGKVRMRKGMTYYLGSHDKYKAELLDVVTFGKNGMAIRYTQEASGVHPDNGKYNSYSNQLLVVLEVEEGKVGVIRIYNVQ